MPKKSKSNNEKPIYLAYGDKVFTFSFDEVRKKAQKDQDDYLKEGRNKRGKERNFDKDFAKKELEKISKGKDLKLKNLQVSHTKESNLGYLFEELLMVGHDQRARRLEELKEDGDKKIEGKEEIDARISDANRQIGGIIGEDGEHLTPEKKQKIAELRKESGIKKIEEARKDKQKVYDLLQDLGALDDAGKWLNIDPNNSNYSKIQALYSLDSVLKIRLDILENGKDSGGLKWVLEGNIDEKLREILLEFLSGKIGSFECLDKFIELHNPRGQTPKERRDIANEIKEGLELVSIYSESSIVDKKKEQLKGENREESKEFLFLDKYSQALRFRANFLNNNRGDDYQFTREVQIRKSDSEGVKEAKNLLKEFVFNGTGLSKYLDKVAENIGLSDEKKENALEGLEIQVVRDGKEQVAPEGINGEYQEILRRIKITLVDDEIKANEGKIKEKQEELDGIDDEIEGKIIELRKKSGQEALEKVNAEGVRLAEIIKALGNNLNNAIKRSVLEEYRHAIDMQGALLLSGRDHFNINPDNTVGGELRKAGQDKKNERLLEFLSGEITQEQFLDKIVKDLVKAPELEGAEEEGEEIYSPPRDVVEMKEYLRDECGLMSGDKVSYPIPPYQGIQEALKALSEEKDHDERIAILNGIKFDKIGGVNIIDSDSLSALRDKTDEEVEAKKGELGELEERHKVASGKLLRLELERADLQKYPNPPIVDEGKKAGMERIEANFEEMRANDKISKEENEQKCKDYLLEEYSDLQRENNIKRLLKSGVYQPQDDKNPHSFYSKQRQLKKLNDRIGKLDGEIKKASGIEKQQLEIDKAKTNREFKRLGGKKELKRLNGISKEAASDGDYDNLEVEENLARSLESRSVDEILAYEATDKTFQLKLKIKTFSIEEKIGYANKIVLNKLLGGLKEEVRDKGIELMLLGPSRENKEKEFRKREEELKKGSVEFEKEVLVRQKQEVEKYKAELEEAIKIGDGKYPKEFYRFIEKKLEDQHALYERIKLIAGGSKESRDGKEKGLYKRDKDGDLGILKALRARLAGVEGLDEKGRILRDFEKHLSILKAQDDHLKDLAADSQTIRKFGGRTGVHYLDELTYLRSAKDSKGVEIDLFREVVNIDGHIRTQVARPELKNRNLKTVYNDDLSKKNADEYARSIHLRIAQAKDEMEKTRRVLDFLINSNPAERAKKENEIDPKTGFLKHNPRMHSAGENIYRGSQFFSRNVGKIYDESLKQLFTYVTGTNFREMREDQKYNEINVANMLGAQEDISNPALQLREYFERLEKTHNINLISKDQKEALERLSKDFDRLQELHREKLSKNLSEADERFEKKIEELQKKIYMALPWNLVKLAIFISPLAGIAPVLGILNSFTALHGIVSNPIVTELLSGRLVQMVMSGVAGASLLSDALKIREDRAKIRSDAKEESKKIRANALAEREMAVKKKIEESAEQYAVELYEDKAKLRGFAGGDGLGGVGEKGVVGELLALEGDDDKKEYLERLVKLFGIEEEFLKKIKDNLDNNRINNAQKEIEKYLKNNAENPEYQKLFFLYKALKDEGLPNNEIIVKLEEYKKFTEDEITQPFNAGEYLGENKIERLSAGEVGRIRDSYLAKNDRAKDDDEEELEQKRDECSKLNQKLNQLLGKDDNDYEVLDDIIAIVENANIKEGNKKEKIDSINDLLNREILRAQESYFEERIKKGEESILKEAYIRDYYNEKSISTERLGEIKKMSLEEIQEKAKGAVVGEFLGQLGSLNNMILKTKDIEPKGKEKEKEECVPIPMGVQEGSGRSSTSELHSLEEEGALPPRSPAGSSSSLNPASVFGGINDSSSVRFGATGSSSRPATKGKDGDSVVRVGVKSGGDASSNTPLASQQLGLPRTRTMAVEEQPSPPSSPPSPPSPSSGIIISS